MITMVTIIIIIIIVIIIMILSFRLELPFSDHFWQCELIISKFRHHLVKALCGHLEYRVNYKLSIQHSCSSSLSSHAKTPPASLPILRKKGINTALLSTSPPPPPGREKRSPLFSPRTSQKPEKYGQAGDIQLLEHYSPTKEPRSSHLARRFESSNK